MHQTEPRNAVSKRARELFAHTAFAAPQASLLRNSGLLDLDRSTDPKDPKEAARESGSLTESLRLVG